MNVTIIGGAGFIGSRLAAHYCSMDAKVTVLDDFRTGLKTNLAHLSLRLIKGSVLDRKKIKYAIRDADVVFHLASIVSVDESVNKPSETISVNLIGLSNLIEECRLANTRKLVFSSSSAVYGDSNCGPIDEDAPKLPKSPYAITKLSGELLLSLLGNIETVSLRFFNVYGPGQNVTSSYAAVIPSFIECALKGQPLNIYGDGTQTRDFVYVDDVVRALALVAGEKNCELVYNVGSGRAASINELAIRINEMIGSNSEIQHHLSRVGEAKHSLASISKIMTLGWSPDINLEVGLRRSLEFYKQK